MKYISNKVHIMYEVYTWLNNLLNSKYTLTPAEDKFVANHKDWYDEMVKIKKDTYMLRAMEKTLDVGQDECRAEIKRLSVLFDEKKYELYEPTEKDFNFFKERSQRNWDWCEMAHRLSFREMYGKLFNNKGFMDGYEGHMIRDCFNSHFDGETCDPNTDEIGELLDALHTRADNFREEWKSLKHQYSTIQGQTRKLIMSGDKKYIFKVPKLKIGVQSYMEISAWFTTRNPFLVPLEYFFIDDNKPILVYPNIEKPFNTESMDSLIANINKFGSGLMRVGAEGPLFFDGLELHAYMTSWREHRGVPLVVDYGEHEWRE